MKQKVWIDCDPGHDDAVAMMLIAAYEERFELLGVSTVGGNHQVEKMTTNAKNILHSLGVSVPLIQGLQKPLVDDLTTGDYAHGDSGMDGPLFNKVDYPIITEEPIARMYETIINHNSPVTVIGLGPLTNIASLLIAYPQVKHSIERIVFMGGGIDKGNVTPTAEFNAYVDPHALKVILNSGIACVMAGLNVTERAYIEEADFSKWKNQSEIHQLYYELLRFYFESGKQFGYSHSALHDAVTSAYLIKPELFHVRDYPIHIVTEGAYKGTTLADKRQHPEWINRISVLEEIEQVGFKNLIDEGLDRLVKERQSLG